MIVHSHIQVKHLNSMDIMGHQQVKIKSILLHILDILKNIKQKCIHQDYVLKDKIINYLIHIYFDEAMLQ